MNIHLTPKLMRTHAATMTHTPKSVQNRRDFVHLRLDRINTVSLAGIQEPPIIQFLLLLATSCGFLPMFLGIRNLANTGDDAKQSPLSPCHPAAFLSDAVSFATAITQWQAVQNRHS